MTSRLLLAHPEPFFRQCLSSALEDHPALSVVGVTGDEKEAESLAGSGVDVVLTAPVLDAGSGLGLIRRVRATVPVVVLTSDEEWHLLLPAVEAGAAGLVGHESGLERLAELLADRVPGRFVADLDRLGDTLRKVAAARNAAAVRPSRLDVLSAREREILSGIAEGLDNDGIAARFYLSPNTVRTHVGNILKKLGVHSRAEAARLALRESARGAETNVLHVQGPDLSRGA